MLLFYYLISVFYCRLLCPQAKFYAPAGRQGFVQRMADTNPVVELPDTE